MFGREINDLYLHETLRNFGMSMIGVFIPIYIITQQFPLLYAALFIVLSGITGIVFAYPLARVAARLGVRHGIAVSYLLVVPGILLIRSAPISLSVIVVSGLLYNLGRVLHNVALNAEFAADSDTGTRDRDSGRMLSIPSIARVIAPFLGGTVFAVLGFTELAALSIGVLFLSIVPLLLSTDHRDEFSYRLRDMAMQEHWRALPLFTIRGIQAVSAVSVFGLFVYTQIGGSVDVGGARALDSLGFALTGLLASRLAERYGRQTVLLLGVTGAAGLHLLRGILATPLQVFLLSFIAGIFFQIYHVPLYAWFADRSEEKDALEFYTLRKMFVSLGNVLTITTLALGLLVAGQRAAFTATFVLASASTAAMGIWFHRFIGDS